MLASSGQIRRRTSVAFLAVLLWVSPVSAQSIVDARRVEFTPSSDHSRVDGDGVALVDRYSLHVFVAGATTAMQTVSLGKPVPGTDGMVRLDFVALLPTALTPGVIYEVLVEAVGPGGSSGGPRSNTFAFTPPCAPSISPVTQAFAASGGTGSSTVTVAAGCAWTAASNASWIAVTGGASGTGPGPVTFSVAANTATTNRSGTLTIAGATFNVTQSGACAYSISPSSQAFTAAAGTGSSTVTAGAGCAWTTASNASWISVTGGASGTGPGTASFSVAANTATTNRSGTLTIAGTTFNVTQSGACAYSISPSSQAFTAAAGTGSSTVTAGAGCAWTAASNASWISVTGGASGTGPGTASFSVSGEYRDNQSVRHVDDRRDDVQRDAVRRVRLLDFPDQPGVHGGGRDRQQHGDGRGRVCLDRSEQRLVDRGDGRRERHGPRHRVLQRDGEYRHDEPVRHVDDRRDDVQRHAVRRVRLLDFPDQPGVHGAAGTGSSTVTAGAGCAWTAASNASWIVSDGRREWHGPRHRVLQRERRIPRRPIGRPR